MAVQPTETSLAWVNGTLFETIGPGGDRLQLDMPLAKGGSGVGFSPMTLLLHAVAACMAVTVVQILAKQRVTLESYRLDIVGERAPEPPSPYTRIVVTHRLRGDGLTQANVERLVQLVEERYCSVAATLPRGLIEHIVILGATDETDAQQSETVTIA
ncbi:MAG: OsmC family protein [Chloroflexota bacterium]